MQQLPYELNEKILNYLTNPIDVCNASLVCKEWERKTRDRRQKYCIAYLTKRVQYTNVIIDRLIKVIPDLDNDRKWYGGYRYCNMGLFMQ